MNTSLMSMTDILNPNLPDRPFPIGEVRVFDKQDLTWFARGWTGAGNAQLPAGEMQMLDRVTNISAVGGLYNKGHAVAEYDINPDLWFFKCHFIGDPVMPGCLGLDGLWQLIGFNLCWRGFPGKGRAIASTIELTGMITPDVKMLTYRIDIKRIVNRKLKMAIADGSVFADGVQVYKGTDMKVGFFTE